MSLPILPSVFPHRGCPRNNEYDYYVKGCRPNDARPCGCTIYCALRSHASSWEEMSDLLMKDAGRTTVTKETRLQFCGVALWLSPDGTYQIGDTSGC